MGAGISPAQALEQLLEGNRRWIEERQVHPDRSADRRRELAAGQSPFATVFTCIDSRVSPEIVFDCGVGDLAVVRTAGHVLDRGPVLGSLQFCAEQLRTPLVLVMGHERCGAVAAAIDGIESGPGQGEKGGLGALVDALRPAYEQASQRNVDAGTTSGISAVDFPDHMTRVHISLTVQAVAQAAFAEHAIAAGELNVLGAHYNLETGEVSLLDR